MRFSVIFCFFLLGACALNPVHQPKNKVSLTKASSCMGAEAVTGQEMDSNSSETDISKLPAHFNDKVRKWIWYFQTNGRQTMNRYLSRSSRYLPKMKEILKSHGLPEDLVYIAMIESGFKFNAHSRAGAVGYWQFVRGTGRLYGLKQNYYLDERRDFIRSTEAAAKYLKALYNLFGSWYLAIASYNAGENRVKNLVMRRYTRNFWKLARTKRLPRETRNYIPKFLAARLIAKNPVKYGFNDVVYKPPLEFKEVTLRNQGVNLRKLAVNLRVSKKELYDLNPAYKRGVIPKRRFNKLRLPIHIDDKMILASLGKSRSHLAVSIVPKGKAYKIRRGDTLSHIAQRFGISIAALVKANKMSRRTPLITGRELIIP